MTMYNKCVDIKAAIDNNDTTWALLLIAYYMQEALEIRCVYWPIPRLKIIQELHGMEQMMPKGLADYRDDICRRMRRDAEVSESWCTLRILFDQL